MALARKMRSWSCFYQFNDNDDALEERACAKKFGKSFVFNKLHVGLFSDIDLIRAHHYHLSDLTDFIYPAFDTSLDLTER
jgi:hypothetical protein